MEGFFTIFIFLGVIAVTALLFGVWVVATILSAIFRGVGAIFGYENPPPMPSQGVTCIHENCRALNPASANFCKRCGKQIHRVQRVPMRRAAMW